VGLVVVVGSDFHLLSPLSYSCQLCHFEIYNLRKISRSFNRILCVHLGCFVSPAVNCFLSSSVSCLLFPVFVRSRSTSKFTKEPIPGHFSAFNCQCIAIQTVSAPVIADTGTASLVVATQRSAPQQRHHALANHTGSLQQTMWQQQQLPSTTTTTSSSHIVAHPAASNRAEERACCLAC
jgi:hypothetical protein